MSKLLCLGKLGYTQYSASVKKQRGRTTMKKISGLATREGTQQFLDTCQLPNRVATDGAFHDLHLSTLGWGTQSGEAKNIVDLKYETALPLILEAGINLIDTSPSYRHQRSQRALGTALGKRFRQGIIQREALCITTHGGFLAFDRKEVNPEDFLENNILRNTTLEKEDFLGSAWSMHPTWLRYQLDLSSDLMGLDNFDIFFLDAPELGLRSWNRREWEHHLGLAFQEMENFRKEGRIAAWGIASLEGFSDDGKGSCQLDLEVLLKIAEDRCGPDHGFKGIQLPYNLGMLDLLNVKTLGGKSLIDLISNHELFCSSMLSLGQGQLCSDLPTDLKENLGNWPVDAQTALEFVRSTPGCSCSLVGMKTRRHVEENILLQKRSPLEKETWKTLFSS
jgi:aryl-alcohol dehydrogenase-like predicted oxidoreductase